MTDPKIICDACDASTPNFLRARVQESYGLVRHMRHVTPEDCTGCQREQVFGTPSLHADEEGRTA